MLSAWLHRRRVRRVNEEVRNGPPCDVTGCPFHDPDHTDEVSRRDGRSGLWVPKCGRMSRFPYSPYPAGSFRGVKCER